MRIKNAKPFRQNGFTLIEVMVALSVVAIGLMACLKAINQELSQATLLQNKMLGLWLVENKISETRLFSKWPPLGKNEGKQLLFKQNWQWQTTGLETPNNKVRKVEIAVFPALSKDKSPVLTENIYLGQF